MSSVGSSEGGSSDHPAGVPGDYGSAPKQPVGSFYGHVSGYFDISMVYKLGSQTPH